MSDNQKLFAQTAGFIHRMEAGDAREGRTIAERNSYREESPDHMRVSSMVNAVATESRQLLEEIGELRARLSVVLAEAKMPPMGNPPNVPVHCKMAAEMSDILGTLQQARQIVSLTLSQLDL